MKKNLKPFIVPDKNATPSFLLVFPILSANIHPVSPISKTAFKKCKRKLKINWFSLYYSLCMPVFLLVLLILFVTGLLVLKATSLLLIFLIFISPLMPKIKKLKLPFGIELETTLTCKEK